jgi:hypothetical protein
MAQDPINPTMESEANVYNPFLRKEPQQPWRKYDTFSRIIDRIKY